MAIIRKPGLKIVNMTFYTDRSQMFVSCYEESHNCFAFYTASGKMTSMVQWFDGKDAKFDSSDVNVAKMVACIWKQVHPPT